MMAKANRTQKKSKLVPILLVILILAVAAAAFFFLTSRSDSGEEDEVMEPNAVIGPMPGKSIEQIQAELTQQVKEKEVAFAINSSPIRKSGESKVNLMFENPESNGKMTRVELTRDDTGDLLYKSGLLQPGSYIPEVELDGQLEPGVYACTATIYAYKLDSEEFIGKVAAGVSLSIEE